MKISIVLSTYNGENYILDQLESLYNQTRQADEVLILDDKSSDNTVKIIKEFINIHCLDKWKLIINEKNIGWRLNFKNGMLRATGDFVFTCDQDDIWLNNKLDTMEKIMINHPNINVLVTDYIAFYNSGKEYIGPIKLKNEIKQIIVKHRYLNVDFPGCTYCIRADFIKKCANFWDSDFAHDATVYRMAMFSDSLFSYSKPLIRWRKHDDSSFSKEVSISRTKENKINEIKYLQRQNKYLLEYVDIINKEHYKKYICNNNKWLDLRMKFYNSKNLKYWLKLFKYQLNYGKFRRWILDFIIVYKKDGN